MALNANDSLSSYRPFGHHWLDSAIQETLLPGSPWHQVYDKLCQALAKRLQPELSNPDKRAVIFDLLGSGFLQKYLSKTSWEVPVKNLEHRTPEERRLILQSTQILLKEKLDLAATDCGYLIPKDKTGTPSSSSDSQQGPKAVPEEVIATVSKMAEIFSMGMHRYLVQEQMKNIAATDNQTDGTSKNKQLKENIFHQSKDIYPQDNLPPPVDDDNSRNCWGPTSDLLGKSLCVILHRDPNRLDEVCHRLSGRQLPGSLRYRVWNEVMLRSYKEANKGEKSPERFLRKNFAKTVLKSKVELEIDSTTESPIDGLLKTAVQEKYNNTPCMLRLRGSSLQKDVREVLNILYVYDRSYQPYYIHWLYPLQLAFRDRNPSGDKTDDDQPYELALQLNLLRSHVFPAWSEILAVAEDTMHILRTEDPEFHAHLMECSKTNIRIDPKDFLVQQIHEEHQKALSLITNVDVNSVLATGESSKEMLASPVMFLRKWLGEGFVGVLDTQAVLYTWDQCFMCGWSHAVLQRLCFTILLLLRQNYMVVAQDYHVMKQIFLGEPSRLYTLDIQKAYQHLQSGGALSQVTSMNRRHVQPPVRTSIGPKPITESQSPHNDDVGTPDPPPPPEGFPVIPQTLHPPASSPPEPNQQTDRPKSATSLPDVVHIPISSVPEIESDEADKKEGVDTSSPTDSIKKESPKPATPPPQDAEPDWVPFDISLTSELPKATSPKEGFDLYVDAVRFLPDNATITKVTGRVINPVNKNAQDLSAQPELNSRSRCAKFKQRITMETSKPGSLYELRVYTVDKSTHQLVVIGSCLLQLYKPNSGKLNIGGHQLRLRSDVPNLHQPVLPLSMDHKPAVPGCSLLVRLLTKSEDFVEAPLYQSGYYQSDSCQPTESEINVIAHYKKRSGYSTTERGAILALIKLEGDKEDNGDGDDKKRKEEEIPDEELMIWMMERQDGARLIQDKDPRLLNLVYCVEYDIDAGLAIRVRTAFGLKAESRFSFALARLLPGPDARQQSEAGGGLGKRAASFLTKEMDFDSLMKSPKWTDRPRVLHPHYDEHSILLVQFFGVEVTYHIDASARTKGVIKGRHGKGKVKLDRSSYLGWGLVPLFDMGCVFQGTFIIPVFQDSGDRSFLKGLLDTPSLETWIRLAVQNQTIKVHRDHPSAIVSIWDGHFYQGQTIPLPRRDYLLHLAGNFNLFSHTAQNKVGQPLSHIVLQSLPSVVQSEGTKSKKYQKEKDNCQSLIYDLATELMEDALLSTGRAPLTE